ncbi:MAG TPA: hypothetical protein VHI93_04950, partial [Candidatus Thermoplasmatota archaeon]|nr:hypothetical protein [Candidatus Thermoplasmatota archaeon]
MSPAIAWSALRSPTGVRSLAFALLGLAGLAANLSLPILWVPGSPGRLAFRDDLAQPAAVPYERHLADWPIQAGVAVAVLGVFLLLLTLRPAWAGRWHTMARDALVASCGAGGLLLALVGARWLGFYLARLLDNGPALVHLHAVPYLDLALGLAILGCSIQALWPAARTALRSPEGIALAVCLAGLLLLPALPAAVAEAGGVRFHYDEVSLETLFGRPPSVAAAGDWTWARLLLDATAVVAAGAVAWRLLRLPGARWAPLSIPLPLAGATAFAVQFFLHAGGLPGHATPWPNPLPLV